MTNWDKLIFEVKCLGCGDIGFTLPYREGKHHTMTCSKCNEVSIFHVLKDGHLAMATLEQRDNAINLLLIELKEFIETFRVRLITQNERGDSYHFVRELRWDRMKNNYGYIGKCWYGEDNEIHYNIIVKAEGLLSKIQVEHQKIDNPKNRWHIPSFDFSAFQNILLVSQSEKIK